MTITLKNVKYAAFASQETYCFAATIWIDGVKVGDAENDGHGGETRINPPALRQRLDDHARTLPTVETEVGGDPFAYQPSGASLIDDLIDDWIALRDLKRETKKRIVFTRYEGKIYHTAPMDPEVLKHRLTDPGLKDRLQADIILNTVPDEIALSLWKKGTAT